jgi:hypothetical protein
LLAVGQDRDRPAGVDLNRAHDAARGAIGGGKRVADQAACLRDLQRGQQGIELGVGIDLLLDL